MKAMYEPRTYRDLFSGEGLQFFDVRIQETDLRIGAGKRLYNEAYASVQKYRAQIETYIRLYPDFLSSLEPVDCMPGAPAIISRMCEASKKAGVGPMAAVAGAVSEMTGIDLLEHTDEVIIENGGDIFMKTSIARKVGIYAGQSPLSGKIAIEISPESTPAGICTSSGTVGHSLSFGKADAAVVLSKDTFLADAAATAAGNIVKSAEDIEKALEFASCIEGVVGAVIIVGDKMGAWGDVKLVRF
jgi:ApbE superfamily uncharacterized protein (UPF0280 family)